MTRSVQIAYYDVALVEYHVDPITMDAMAWTRATHATVYDFARKVGARDQIQDFGQREHDCMFEHSCSIGRGYLCTSQR